MLIWFANNYVSHLYIFFTNYQFKEIRLGPIASQIPYFLPLQLNNLGVLLLSNLGNCSSIIIGWGSKSFEANTVTMRVWELLGLAKRIVIVFFSLV